ncbi:MAG TPA: RNA polymerase sigma factor RpoD, partial [Alphaproteobacteria bacterium]|nr:RNA polymerase sigma factor RpoD [Alphaproteobacteria bacterium]
MANGFSGPKGNILAMAKAAKTAQAKTSRDETPDSPLLDTLGADVKKMIKLGKERGYVTYDELNKTLPPEQVSSEQIEDTMSMLSDMGINVVDNEEAEDPEKTSASEGSEPAGKTGNVDEADIGRTDDPVRMYLREMGSVELLSREGEIAIAKRIEAGRKMMIGGVDESPLTVRAIVAWHDALKGELMLLRDIIDLDATNGGGPGAPPANGNEGNGKKTAGEEAKPATKSATDGKETRASGKAEGEKSTGDKDDDDDGEEVNLSLAALEAKLTPEMIVILEDIAKAYKKFHRLQLKRMEAFTKGEKISPAQERRYGKLRRELVDLVNSVFLNNARIEQLVEQLYELNRVLISFEGKLLRMATTSKVKREDFLEEYRGDELNPDWLERVAGLAGKGWKRFATRYADDIDAIREGITEISQEVGL